MFDDILDTLLGDIQEALMEQSAQEALNFRSPVCNAPVIRSIERAAAHAQDTLDSRLEAMAQAYERDTKS